MPGGRQTMDFLAPFSNRDPVSGLCVLPEGLQRREMTPAKIETKHSRQGAVPSMTLSPDHKLCAVACGSTIAVYTTDPLATVQAYQKKSYSYAITDVVWSPHVNDPKIVMSGSNGTLTVWDPHAFEQSSSTEAEKFKKEMDVTDTRIVRKLAWHPYHPDLIIAGKYDGCADIIDLRQLKSWSYPSRDSFSMRKSMHQVTDVAFCPVPTQPQHFTDETSGDFASQTSGVGSAAATGVLQTPVTYDQNVFLSAHNNGSLSLWDSRKTQFPIMTVSAHPSSQAVIMRMEWHPLGLYLATCGAGGVKLWSVNPPAGGPSSGSGTGCFNLVQWVKSVNSVSFVHWRPQPGEVTTAGSAWSCTAATATASALAAANTSCSASSNSYRYQLASCPQCTETFLSLWDFRNTNIARAYIGDFVPDSPQASYQTTTTVNNFLWLDADSLITTHTDNMLRVSTLSRNTKVPFKTLRPVSFAMDPAGLVTATSSRVNILNPFSNRILMCAPPQSYDETKTLPKARKLAVEVSSAENMLPPPSPSSSSSNSGMTPKEGPSGGIKIASANPVGLGSSSPMPSPRNMPIFRKSAGITERSNSPVTSGISSFSSSSSSSPSSLSSSSSTYSAQSSAQNSMQLPWLSRSLSNTQYLMSLYRSSSSIMTKASEDYVFKEMARRCLLAPFGEIKDKWMVCRYNARVSDELGCPHYAQLWTLVQHAFQQREFTQDDDSKGQSGDGSAHPTSDFFSLWTSPADSAMHSQSTRVSGMGGGVDSGTSSNTGNSNLSIGGDMLLSTEHQEEPDEEVKAFSVLFSSHQDEFIPMEDETVQPLGDIPVFNMESLVMNCKTEDVAEAPAAVSIENARDYERQSAIYQQMVCDTIHMYSDIGFFQICALLFLVLGDTLLSQKPLAAISSRSILCYIRTLQRMKLYLEASAAIRQCPPSCNLTMLGTDHHLRELNRENTGFSFNSVSSSSKQTPRCCVCGLKVSGLSVWCPGCGHGGHIEHIRAWLQKDSRCPSGCSHMCTFTTSTV